MADLRAEASAAWRRPEQILSHWRDAGGVDPALLRRRIRGDLPGLLEEAGLRLLVSREYEHLLVALGGGARIEQSYLPVPHPSGITVDRDAGTVWFASTRNPNQVFALDPVVEIPERGDVARKPDAVGWLVPTRSVFYPGASYLHDLALFGGRLHGASTGQNAIVELGPAGRAEPVWWPRCVEERGRARLDLNFIQLNGIAAGADLESSYFTASCDEMSRRRPGHVNFPVDRRGVIFSGASREVVCRGLTRPHSPRLHGGRVWVANSGYGQVGYVEDGRLEVVAELDGWTRGLAVTERYVFVGISRVIPKYSHYAPGLDPARCRTGVVAIERATGREVGRIEWPDGDQIFAVEAVEASRFRSLPFVTPEDGARPRTRMAFYSYRTSAGEARG